ncbi:MAG: radical SAM protein [Thermoanaerobaculia bacterium]|nr:radical SAM protein [Thermoanaerobaculia bacterium]MBP9826169.1 radical SAM protein [Thermoanaerobaculia bacterium]
MSEAFDPIVTPPAMLYLSLPVSDICNYRCRHCHIWMHEQGPDALSRERRIELVQEFARLNPQGTVVLPGGEVTLDMAELLAVAGACRDAGLPCVIMTNGSRIDTPEAAQALVTSGVTFCAVSLDSHLAEWHNFTRGLPVAYDEATRAIRLLAEARDRWAPESFRLCVTGVLFKENLPLFPDFVEFCRAQGAQHVDLQVLARTFANAHASRDAFFEKHFWHTPEEKAQARELFTRFLTELDPAGSFLVKRPADLDWILRYVDDPDFTTEEPICGSHHTNLIVDARGDGALCFNTQRILDDPFVGNARSSSLAELWSGRKAAADRAVMDVCTLNCGALNCHRRKPSAEVAVA